MKQLAVGLLLIFTIFVPTTLAAESTPSAQVVDIGTSRIHPASPIYFLKTIRENLELKLAVTKRVKYLRFLEFSNRRLREAKTIIPLNEELIPPTLEKYYLNLRALPDKALQDQEVEDRIISTLSTHILILGQMYDHVSTTRAKMAIRTAMNRITQRADTRQSDKLVICHFFEKEASSSSLNEVEQLVLKDRAKKCLKTP